MLFPATSKDLLLQQQHYCEWPHSFTVLILFWQQIPSVFVCFLKKSITPVWGAWIEAAHRYSPVFYLWEQNCGTWWLYCLLAWEWVHYLQNPNVYNQLLLETVLILYWKPQSRRQLLSKLPRETWTFCFSFVIPLFTLLQAEGYGTVYYFSTSNPS